MDAVQILCIEQCNDILREKLDRIGSRREGRLTMASRVVAQEMELLTKLRSLRVPHGIVRAERIRKHQHGRSILAFQRVVNPRFTRFEDGHRAYSSPIGILFWLAAR